MSIETCKEKQQAIVDDLADIHDLESTFRSLIEIGRNLDPLPPEYKTPENQVRGCQSTVYIHHTLHDGRMHFTAEANSLIAAGLVSLIITVYNNETPETILNCEPTFVKDIGLTTYLTPGRANGLANILLHIKHLALRETPVGDAVPHTPCQRA